MIRALLFFVVLLGCDPEPERDGSPSPAVDTSGDAGADPSPRGHRDETPIPVFSAPAELLRSGCEPELIGERCPLCGPLECSPGVWSCKEGRMVCGTRRWSA